MRYTEDQRKNYPTADDKRLWLALDEIGIEYKKIANINPEQQDKRENWMIPALVFLPQPARYATAGIIFKNDMPHSKQPNKRTRIVMDRIKGKCRERNIPLLTISRNLSKLDLVYTIKKWIIEMKGE